MTLKLNVEKFSLQDGDVLPCTAASGGRCALTPGGRRRLVRASSMPGRVQSSSCGSTRRGPRPRRSPVMTTAFQPEILPLRYGPPDTPIRTSCGKSGGIVPSVSMDVEVTVSPASTSGSAGRVSTASSTLRRQLGSTSFIFRRKRVHEYQPH